MFKVQPLPIAKLAQKKFISFGPPRAAKDPKAQTRKPTLPKSCVPKRLGVLFACVNVKQHISVVTPGDGRVRVRSI